MYINFLYLMWSSSNIMCQEPANLVVPSELPVPCLYWPVPVPHGHTPDRLGTRDQWDSNTWGLAADTKKTILSKCNFIITRNLTCTNVKAWMHCWANMVISKIIWIKLSFKRNACLLITASHTISTVISLSV